MILSLSLIIMSGFVKYLDGFSQVGLDYWDQVRQRNGEMNSVCRKGDPMCDRQATLKNLLRHRESTFTHQKPSFHKYQPNVPLEPAELEYETSSVHQDIQYLPQEALPPLYPQEVDNNKEPVYQDGPYPLQDVSYPLALQDENLTSSEYLPPSGLVSQSEDLPLNDDYREQQPDHAQPQIIKNPYINMKTKARMLEQARSSSAATIPFDQITSNVLASKGRLSVEDIEQRNLSKAIVNLFLDLISEKCTDSLFTEKLTLLVPFLRIPDTLPLTSTVLYEIFRVQDIQGNQTRILYMLNTFKSLKYQLLSKLIFTPQYQLGFVREPRFYDLRLLNIACKFQPEIISESLNNICQEFE